MRVSRRKCCCDEGCTNPTGTHNIDVNVVVDADVPTGIFGGTQSIYFSEVWDLEYSGTSLVTANSSVRFRAESHGDLRYPDNSVYSQWDRVIDVTLDPAGGDWFCGQAAAQYCSDCLSKGFFRLDPRVRMPHLVNGVQQGGVTVNANTNTYAGATATNPWEDVVVGWRTNNTFPVNSFAMWGRDDLGSVVQPTFTTGTGWTNNFPDGYPAVVYRQPSGFGICTPINHNKICGYRNVPFSAGYYCDTIGPVCPSDKTVLESQGYVFNSYTRTASIT